MRRIALALGVLAGVALARGQETVSPGPASRPVSPVARSVLTLAEQEHFLLTARIVGVRSVKEGATGTQRATLTDGTITHDASVQPIDESAARYETPERVELNFRDYWGYNVAAYRLGVLLGLDMIPPSVARHHRSRLASFTWWIDDVILDEKGRVARKTVPPDRRSWNAQNLIVRVFDELIANTDRNQGNLLIDTRWKVWMIDHTRAFRITNGLRDERRILRCERSLFRKLEALTAAEMKARLDDYLTPYEQAAVLQRRDRLVARIEALGPAALYDMPPP
jgi:hypothetical protein